MTMIDLGLEITSRFVGINDEASMFDWFVTLKRGEKTHTLDYHCGFGHCSKPMTSPRGNAVKLDNHKLARAVKGTGRLTIADTEGYVIPNEPVLADVLQSLQLDAQSGEHLLFEDFASEFGYDTDSRAAEKIWRACQETRGKLQKFFGTDFDAFMNHNFDE